MLKKKLSDSVKALTEKIEKEEPKKVVKKVSKEKKVEKFIKKKHAEKITKPKEIIKEKPKMEAPKEKPEMEKELREEKKSFLQKIGFKKEEKYKPTVEEPKEEKSFFQKSLKENDIDEFFKDIELGLLESNIALEAVDELKKNLKEQLVDKPVSRVGAGKEIKIAFEKSVRKILDQGTVDIDKIIREARKENRSACFVFLGFNGSGKTTSLSKFAQFLMKKKYRVLFAAADTFRAASIEQLEYHGNKLGIKVIKHQYGADAAAVIFDAKKHGEKNNYDVVLADTAGRSHADKNLMDELKKLVRVNKPDLKILVIDSITGNDSVEQANRFNDAVGVDAVILTKTDVNSKGGSILSVCQAIKKPILFLGTGQDYKDIDIFNPEKFAEELLSGD